MKNPYREAGERPRPHAWRVTWWQKRYVASLQWLGIGEPAKRELLRADPKDLSIFQLMDRLTLECERDKRYVTNAIDELRGRIDSLRAGRDLIIDGDSIYLGTESEAE